MEDFGWGVTGLIIVLILALLVVSTFQNTTRELLIRTCEAELPRDQQCELIAVPKPREAP